GMLIVAALLIVTLSYDLIRRGLLRLQAISPNLVAIEAGNYLLGDEQRKVDNSDDYLPYMEYSIPAFSVDANPVTNERYGYCIQAGICSRPNALRAEYAIPANANKLVVNIT